MDFFINAKGFCFTVFFNLKSIKALLFAHYYSVLF